MRSQQASVTPEQGALFLNSSLKLVATHAAKVIRPFLSASQLSAMADGCGGEEKEFFMQKFVELANLINTMPKTYEQDGKGDQAMACLHYFTADGDWYITEKDIEGGVDQAFGYAILGGFEAFSELGYISIAELVECGAELDLHFTPCTLAEIKAQHAAKSEPVVHNPNPWVIVTQPGTDDEDIWADFPTYDQAISALFEADEGADIMKRLNDGSLTTDFSLALEATGFEGGE